MCVEGLEFMPSTVVLVLVGSVESYNVFRNWHSSC